jgi:RNA polymerase sigma-70 factor, ECF subfamily
VKLRATDAAVFVRLRSDRPSSCVKLRVPGNLSGIPGYLYRMIFSRRNTEAKSPSRAAIGELYDQHAPWLLAVCLRYAGNREDAEDVLHEGFMKIIRNIENFRSKQEGSMEAWMRRIMVNTSLNYIRDHKKEKMFIGLDSVREPEQISDEDNDFGGCDFTESQLMDLICELPSGYRTVFNLYVMEDYTHKEIAELLGISENTSKSQLSKARNLLRKRLLDYQNKLNYATSRSDR